MSEHLGIVRAAVAAAVGLEESEVAPDAAVFGELGAESIDLLDILFRIERACGVRIQAADIAEEELAAFTVSDLARLVTDRATANAH